MSKKTKAPGNADGRLASPSMSWSSADDDHTYAVVPPTLPQLAHTVKDSPQEQLFTSLGFFSTKPERIKLSCHSRTEPPR